LSTIAECTGQAAPAQVLTGKETCDRCGPGTQAMVRVQMPSGNTLDFCRHDYRKHEPALVAQGATVIQEA
jgi:hypothetical protein